MNTYRSTLVDILYSSVRRIRSGEERPAVEKRIPFLWSFKLRAQSSRVRMAHTYDCLTFQGEDATVPLGLEADAVAVPDALGDEPLLPPPPGLVSGFVRLVPLMQ